jgi:Zn-dependent protease
MTPTTTAYIFIFALVLYGTSLHEMGHAFVAYWLGDPTPGRYGRLTLNPLAHLKPVMTAVIIPLVMYFGSNFQGLLAMASTPVDPTRFRKPLRDMALVSLVGPAMNFLLAGFLIGILWLEYGFHLWWPNSFHDSEPSWLTVILPTAALWNIILGVFNLLPFPPLDGYSLVRPILPLTLRRQMDAWGRMGIMSMLVVLALGGYMLNELLPPLLIFWAQLLPPNFHVGG